MRKKLNLNQNQTPPPPPPSELELLGQTYSQLAMKLGDLTYQCDALKQEMRALNLRADQITKAQTQRDTPDGAAAAP